MILSMKDDLVEADDDDIMEAPTAVDRMKIELVWRERLPLGMSLLMNDESGLLKVVEFPRGSVSLLRLTHVMFFLAIFYLYVDELCINCKRLLELFVMVVI